MRKRFETARMSVLSVDSIISPRRFLEGHTWDERSEDLVSEALPKCSLNRFQREKETVRVVDRPEEAISLIELAGGIVLRIHYDCPCAHLFAKYPAATQGVDEEEFADPLTTITKVTR